MACLASTYPEEGAYPLYFPDFKASVMAVIALDDGFRFPKMVGSPIDSDIIGLSG